MHDGGDVWAERLDRWAIGALWVELVFLAIASTAVALLAAPFLALPGWGSARVVIVAIAVGVIGALAGLAALVRHRPLLGTVLAALAAIALMLFERSLDPTVGVEIEGVRGWLNVVGLAIPPLALVAAYRRHRRLRVPPIPEATLAH